MDTRLATISDEAMKAFQANGLQDQHNLYVEGTEL
jgi:hypothetical protein